MFTGIVIDLVGSDRETNSVPQQVIKPWCPTFQASIINQGHMSVMTFIPFGESMSSRL